MSPEQPISDTIATLSPVSPNSVRALSRACTTFSWEQPGQKTGGRYLFKRLSILDHLLNLPGLDQLAVHLPQKIDFFVG